jgi:hypothetical protein
MHGYSIKDEEDNLVRVLDFIKGKSLHSHVESINAVDKWENACRAVSCAGQLMQE